MSVTKQEIKKIMKLYNEGYNVLEISGMTAISVHMVSMVIEQNAD